MRRVAGQLGVAVQLGRSIEMLLEADLLLLLLLLLNVLFLDNALLSLHMSQRGSGVIVAILVAAPPSHHVTRLELKEGTNIMQ